MYGNPADQITARFSRRQIFFLASFAGALFSRIGIFLSGYTSDDYVYAFGMHDYSWHAIHQGRFLGPLVSRLVGFLQFSLVSVQLPLFIISLFVLSALVSKVIDSMILNSRSTLWLGIAAAAIAASYPYLTAYYLFRMVLLDQILVYSTVWLAMHVMTSEKLGTIQRILAGSLVVGLGSGDNQLVFMLFGVCAMAWFARSIFIPVGQQENDSSLRSRASRWQLAIAPATVVAGFVIYTVTIKLVQATSGIPAEGSYSIDLVKGMAHIITTDLRLVIDVLARTESIIPSYMKVVLLVVLAGLVVQAALVSVRNTIVCLVFLFLGLALSVAPMAVSSGGHVARIFVCAGFAISLFIALIGNFVDRPKAPAVALLVLAFFYGCSGAAMFYQQHVLSQWDQTKAWSIYVDVARQFDAEPNTNIHLVNGSKIHGERLSTYGDDDYGVNESAFRSDWSYAYPALFEVATGKSLNVSSATPDKCLGKPAWPRSGAIFSEGKDDIYVCL